MTTRVQQIAHELQRAGYAQMSLPELAEWVERRISEAMVAPAAALVELVLGPRGNAK